MSLHNKEIIESQAKKIKNMLIEKSMKSLEIARKEILAERIRSEDVRKALAYYVANWKEATHPGLTSFACEAVGGDPEKATQTQVAILLLTAAIDIHDDIIDKSKKKNGKFTVFGKFGKDIAILVGNGFLIKSFTHLNDAIELFSPEEKKEIFELIKNTFYEVGDAHALELKLRGKWDVNPDEYLQILKMKAASVEAETHIGALIGGGTPQEIETLSLYGRILGTLSTLREEFVDIFEVHELRNRSQNECLPIPMLYALQDEKAKKQIQRIFSKKTITEKDAWETVDTVFQAKGVKKLKRKMLDMIGRAVNALTTLRESKAKEILKASVKTMLEDL